MTNSSTIVQRVWNDCNVLRDDGVSYGDDLARQCGRSIRAGGGMGEALVAYVSPLQTTTIRECTHAAIWIDIESETDHHESRFRLSCRSPRT